MNTYHVVFYTSPDNYHSKGVNIEANTMEEVLEEFQKEYKVEPLYIMTK